VTDGTSSRGGRRWLIVVVVLGLVGAAAGAWAGRRVMPEEPAVAVSLAVAGLGLGGLIAMVGLGFRSLISRATRMMRRPRVAAAPPAFDAQDASADASAPPPARAADAAPEPPAHDPEPAAVPEPEPQPEPPAGEEAGWYPDPQQAGTRRYWDGQAWTDHVWRDRGPAPRRGSRESRSRS
jgi:hypothetical protein